MPECLRTRTIDTTIQKAFQNCIPGCEEHQFTLSSVIRDANQHQRSLTIVWLDIADAYGSVNYHLIQFALPHCLDIGYCLISSNRVISILQYANDSSLFAKSAAKCQQMLHAMEVWLNWPRMSPKVPKCRSLVLQSRKASNSHFFNPDLTPVSEEIPFLGIPVS